MFKSAIVTLTLWYVLLSTILCLLVSGVVYHFSTRELSEALRNQYAQLANSDHDSDNQRYVPTQELDTRSQHLLQNLIYFNVVVLAGSSVASYALARRTLRPIEAAHQAQIRFTAEASHELRTPLAAMKADTEATLMDDRNDAVMLRWTLQGNLHDIEKLEKLTNHLLEISRYKSKATPVWKDVELGTIIEDVLKQFRQPISASHIEITTDTKPVHLKGDPQALCQLVTIVLDNAIKYSPDKGSIRVVLTKANKQATLTIADTGMGIRAEDLPHIFESFYRSQKVATSEHKLPAGYGLGLPLAREIVEVHNGTIGVHSKENNGTVVTIKLPLS
jgi:signal transduction histidine kinase